MLRDGPIPPGENWTFSRNRVHLAHRLVPRMTESLVPVRRGRSPAVEDLLLTAHFCHICGRPLVCLLEGYDFLGVKIS